MKYKLVIDKHAEEEIIAVVHAPSSLTQQIENLVCSYSGADSLMGYRDDEMRKLAFEEIECITIDERKLFIIDRKGQKYRTAGSLSDIEEKLPNYFIRINKSSIANERRISCYKTTFSGGVDAIFKCGHRDYVSRRCFAEIKRRYKV